MSTLTEPQDWLAINAGLPELSQALEAYAGSFWGLSEIPSSTLALCQLRVDQLHASDQPSKRLAKHVADEQMEHLSQWPTHSAFSDGERAALAFTEMYVMDVAAITDEQADAVKAVYGEAGLVALIHVLGLFYAQARSNKLWEK